MKILLLCTSESVGGAAVVTARLAKAFRDCGHEARLLTLDRAASPMRRRASFLAERAGIFLRNGLNRPDLFKVSTADFGVPVASHEDVKWADVILLSWVNQGFLSLDEVARLGATGKPMVWVMHDMWCMTGLCHHAYECTRYEQHCGMCPFIRGRRKPHDLSFAGWERKDRLYKQLPDMQFVAVSQWLQRKAQASSLLHDRTVHLIPNPFPIDLWPVGPGPDKWEKVILFGAARLDDPIKNVEAAITALNTLADRRPDIASHVRAVFFGSCRRPELFHRLKVRHELPGILPDIDVVRRLFQSGSVVLSSSRYETLPTTLIEGMAAGCVPVAFHSGGQSDIIDHLVTGYLAEADSPESLADGLEWALTSPPSRAKLPAAVEARFSPAAIASRFLQLLQ